MKLAYILILLAATAWGSIGIAGEKLFTLGLSPSEVIWFRAFISFSALFVFTLANHRERLKINRHHIPLFILYGLISVALFYLAYFNAVQKAGIAMAAILLYTAPAMVVVLSRYFFKETIDRMKIVCVALTVTGCFLVVKGYDVSNLRLNLAGILWGLLSGFCYAMYSIFGKNFAKTYHPWTIVIYSQGIGGVFLTIWNFPKEVFASQYGIEVWLYLFYIGLVPTLFAYLCYNAALKYIAPGKASIIATLEPVMAVLFAYLLLGQVLEPVQMLGAFFVIIAVLAVQMPGGFNLRQLGNKEAVK